MTLPPDLFLRHDQHREALERGELPQPSAGSGRGVIFFVLVFAIVGGLSAWGSVQELRDGAALWRGGQRVEATQTARRAAQGKQRVYYITYAYTLEGQRYEREGRASLSAWERFCEGCPVNARYVPDAPQISRLETERPLVAGGALCAIASLLLSMAGILGASQLQAEREHRRSTDRRRASALRFGTALEVTTQQHSRRKREITLRYQLDGADTPRSLKWQDSARHKQPPAPGARLAFASISDDDLDLL